MKPKTFIILLIFLRNIKETGAGAELKGTCSLEIIFGKTTKTFLSGYLYWNYGFSLVDIN